MMRRILSKALVVGVVVLPMVVVVGHPVAVATCGDVAMGDGSTVEQTQGVIGGLQVEQMAIDGSRMTRAAVCGTTTRAVMSMIPDRVPYEELEDGVVAWSPGGTLLRGGGPSHGWCVTLGFGWPRVSFATDYDLMGHLSRTTGRLNLGVPPSNGIRLAKLDTVSLGLADGERAIPTRVVWRGLIMNLALYTLVVYGVCVPVLVYSRRFVMRRRWSRGVCGRCRYEVGSLDRCPECGAERPVKVGPA